MCFITELSLIRVNILIISIRQAKMVFKYFFLVFSPKEACLTGIYSITVNTKRVGVNYSGVGLTLVSNGTTYNGTTDSSGNYTFSNLTYSASAQLSWRTDGGPYPAHTESSMNVVIDSTKTVNVALTPLYALQFEVGQSNATVKVTGAVSETVNTDATLKATIYDVPVGSVSYTITKDGFTTISDYTSTSYQNS